MTGEAPGHGGGGGAEQERGSAARPVLVGRYRLDALLGSGGMGDVWRATDLLLRQGVAVKQLRIPPDVDADEARLMCERMLREARAAARLRSHPSIVTIHDVVMADERPWIVMELVDGQSLDRVIAARGPLPVRLVATIGLALLDGLSAAHAGAVLHRDVKPANVLLCDDDRVVLTDFGIATMAGDAALTRTDMVNGSPGYVAPERLNGDQGQPASDLWSLGATLYYAVEGRPPYRRDEMLAVLVATVSADPDPMRLAGPLAPLLTGLLHRDPRQRMSAGRAREILHAVHAGDPTPLAPPGRGRGRLVAAIAAAAVLVLGAGLAVAYYPKHAAVAPASAVAVPASAPGTAGAGAGPLVMADPEACSLFTDEAAGAILGAPVRSQFQTHSACMWSTPSSGTFASLTLIRLGSVTQAQDTYTMEMQNMRDEPRRYPGTQVRAATTVGDESFSYLKPYSDNPVHPTMVLFRKRNMLATVYVSATQPGYGQADQFAAAVARSIDKLG